MERLLALINASRMQNIETEEELGMLEFQFDCLASLLLGSHE
jgi:hypothetical protein